jgi:hypothetical protein
MTLSLSPSTLKTGEAVSVSGTVVLDDGNAIAENYTTLFLPEGAVNVTIENGSFGYSFNAPSSAGTYSIRAVITDSNNDEHSKTAALTVEAQPQASGSYSRGGSGGHISRARCGDGTCSSSETCENCAEDCGECIIVETAEPEVAVTEEAEEAVVEETVPEEEARTPATAGVGAASSMFGKVASNPFAWAVLLLTIAGLFLNSIVYSKDRDPLEQRPVKLAKRKDKVNWNKYFEKMKAKNVRAVP